MIGGLQPIRSSWRQAPWDQDQYFFSTEPLRSYSLRNILYDERVDLSFTIAAGHRQHSQSRVRVSRKSCHILLSQILDSPNLVGQVPVFIFPSNRGAQLYPQARGSLFVAFYDSQGYGGIRPSLHVGLFLSLPVTN
jgi:hypothetical protein